MASLVLGGLGTAVGGPIGGAIGGLLGGLIDQNLIIPALFPQAPIDGPKLSEFRLQTVDEGAPANIVYGTDARCAGTIRWTSDIIETTSTEHVGGGKGGGGGARIKTKKYFVHLAIVVSKNQLAEFKKIFAEGKLLYTSTPNVSISGSVFTVTVTGVGSKKRMIITSPPNGPDLSQLQPGADVVIAGFANAGNNGTFRCVASEKNQQTGTSSATFKNSGAVPEAAGAAVTLNQTLPNFDPEKVQAITFYYGDEAQGPDSLIESIEGAGTVPGFRGSAYVVFAMLALGPYGNRVPLMNFVTRSSEGLTVGSTIGKILERSGRAPTDYDVSALTGIANDGYTITGPQTGTASLQAMVIAHNVLEQEGNGVLRCFPRDQAAIVDIPFTDLAAHEGGSDAPRPIEVSDIPDAELPADVTVKFLDKDKDENTGAQKARKNDITTDGTQTIDLGVVMTSGKGVALARRLLWTAWANRQAVSLQLPPKYWYLQENDCIRLTALDFPWLLLIQRIDIGHNWVIMVEARLEIRSVLQQSEEADPPDVTPQLGNMVPPDGEVLGWEGPPTDGSGSPSLPGITFGGAIEDPSSNWGGGTLLWAPEDDDDQYVPLGPVEIEAVIGYSTSVLGIGPSHVWDLTNTLDVFIIGDATLENRTEAEVLNGMNRFYVGGEIIGAQECTLISPNTWRLSKLLRGFRGTEDRIATHALNETVCWLNEGYARFTYNPAWIGSTRWFKFVLAGRDPDDVAGFQMTLNGASLQPLPPCDPYSSRSSGGNITVAWKRRSRAIHDGFAAGQPPLWEEAEHYQVEFRQAGVLIATRDVYPEAGTISPSCTLMVSDPEFGAVDSGAAIDVTVYQMSIAYGRGKPLVMVA